MWGGREDEEDVVCFFFCSYQGVGYLSHTLYLEGGETMEVGGKKNEHLKDELPLSCTTKYRLWTQTSDHPRWSKQGGSKTSLICTARRCAQAQRRYPGQGEKKIPEVETHNSKETAQSLWKKTTISRGTENKKKKKFKKMNFSCLYKGTTQLNSTKQHKKISENSVKEKISGIFPTQRTHTHTPCQNMVLLSHTHILARN